MDQPLLDDNRAPVTTEGRRRNQILSNRQAESSVVTETDCSHRFPISRVRWRPQSSAVRD